MTDLTDLERGVLEKLLYGNHPTLSILREELSVCRCSGREFTGVGFYTELDASAYQGPRPELDLKFGDVIADIPGLDQGAGFLLYIEAGLLVLLEGYTFGEPWPERIEEFELHYTTGYERDWPALSRLLDDVS